MSDEDRDTKWTGGRPTGPASCHEGLAYIRRELQKAGRLGFLVPRDFLLNVVSRRSWEKVKIRGDYEEQEQSTVPISEVKFTWFWVRPFKISAEELENAKKFNVMDMMAREAMRDGSDHA